MNEKEKMLAGELYNSLDEELFQGRTKAKALCHKYNNLSPDKAKEKSEIIKKVTNITYVIIVYKHY